MFHIEDLSHKKGFADLKVDGILNTLSLPTLRKKIEQKLACGQKVRLQLAGIIHCDRNGIHFLRQYRDKIILEGLSEFLRIQIRQKATAGEKQRREKK